MNASTVSIATVLSLALAATARAEPTQLLVAGNAAQTARDAASAAIAAEIRAQGHEVSIPAFAAKEAAAAAKCAASEKPWACIEPGVRGKGFRRVAVVDVDSTTGADGLPGFAVTEHVFVDGVDTVTGSARQCAHCTDEVLAKLAADLTRDTFHTISILGGRTVIVVKSTPRGARVTFDGAVTGTTDTSITTFPGKHKIGFDLDGYQSATRAVEVGDGATTDVEITLAPYGVAVTPVEPIAPIAPIAPKVEPSPTTKPESPTGGLVLTRVDPPEPHSRVVPFALIGAGVVVVAAGIFTISKNESPDADPTKQQPAHLDKTMLPGVGVTIAGAAIGGLGGYLWWRYAHADSAPTMAPVPGGAVLGLATSF